MNLIYHRGLNCHLACVVSIAATLGVDYRTAFSTLWSECDFFDDPNFNICLSKRILSNLETLGAKLEIVNSFPLIPTGELFVVGLDAFHTPWSPIFQNFHEPHFFFAKKETADRMQCFDPTYNQSNIWLKSDDVARHAFELSRLHSVQPQPSRLDLTREAHDVMRNLPQLHKDLLAEINRFNSENTATIQPLIKQIVALINNRYLFQCFLHQYPAAQKHQLFSTQFMSKWEALKNGIYKLSIIKRNGNLADEVRSLLAELIGEETSIANEIASMKTDFGDEVLQSLQSVQ